MKLARYNANDEPTYRARLGLMLGEHVGDVRAAAEAVLAKSGDNQATAIAALRLPDKLVDFLASGPGAHALLDKARAHLESLRGKEGYATGIRGELMFTPVEDCRFHAPVRPAKMIAVGRNFSEHLKEVGLKLPHSVPSAWCKSVSTITGPYREIVRPNCTEKLDYENELAIVIGQKCKNVPRDKAYSVIFGYTVANDVSARDIVRIERKEGNQLLGKMFDTFAPIGPWVVTADEIPDPMNLRIVTRVNGEVRQDGNTSQMIWSIPELISYLSQMTLQPGDVILTGTPSGCANGRDPELSSWFLEPGDVVESEIEHIGTLRNKVVAAPENEGSWKW